MEKYIKPEAEILLIPDVATDATSCDTKLGELFNDPDIG